MIARKYGTRYVPGSARVYANNNTTAQEAHEAVRPTSFARTPEDVSRHLDSDSARLYELIWKRAVASQMESAQQERTTVDVISADRKIVLRATGNVTLFDGFLTLYLEGRDDESDEDGSRLPKLAAGDTAKVAEITPAQHFTEPPPRYSEASLIKKMEELGIGRPSTYTAILTTLKDRGYVRMDKKRLLPEDKGRLLTQLSAYWFRYLAQLGPTHFLSVDPADRHLTTNQGVPVADNQHSLKIGLRGPTAMEDFILREKITHFDHERIPERVVHARGTGAEGEFVSNGELDKFTKAALFKAGVKTPVFVRFSTVAGNKGSFDLARDVRGFAVKLYTREGNWDRAQAALDDEAVAEHDRHHGRDPHEARADNIQIGLEVAGAEQVPAAPQRIGKQGDDGLSLDEQIRKIVR